MTAAPDRATREMVTAMLTENTGMHMLDSGGSSGRAWQRNAGRTVDDFAAEPRATLDPDDGTVTLSVFHFLTERLEYLPDLDTQLQAYAETVPDDPWLAVAEGFAESLGYVDQSNVRRSGFYGLPDSPTFSTWNTYNGEDCLAQVLQGVTLAETGRADSPTCAGAIVLLQIHGGADVRGGYTRPRAFRVTCSDGRLFPYDHAEYSVYCTGVECTWSRDVRGNDVCDRDGTPAEYDPYQMGIDARAHGVTDYLPCPDCGKPLAADAPYPC